MSEHSENVSQREDAIELPESIQLTAERVARVDTLMLSQEDLRAAADAICKTRTLSSADIDEIRQCNGRKHGLGALALLENGLLKSRSQLILAGTLAWHAQPALAQQEDVYSFFRACWSHPASATYLFAPDRKKSSTAVMPDYHQNGSKAIAVLRMLYGERVDPFLRDMGRLALAAGKKPAHPEIPDSVTGPMENPFDLPQPMQPMLAQSDRYFRGTMQRNGFATAKLRALANIVDTEGEGSVAINKAAAQAAKEAVQKWKSSLLKFPLVPFAARFMEMNELGSIIGFHAHEKHIEFLKAFLEGLAREDPEGTSLFKLIQTGSNIGNFYFYDQYHLIELCATSQLLLAWLINIARTGPGHSAATAVALLGGCIMRSQDSKQVAKRLVVILENLFRSPEDCFDPSLAILIVALATHLEPELRNLLNESYGMFIMMMSGKITPEDIPLPTASNMDFLACMRIVRAKIPTLAIVPDATMLKLLKPLSVRSDSQDTAPLLKEFARDQCNPATALQFIARHHELLPATPTELLSRPGLWRGIRVTVWKEPADAPRTFHIHFEWTDATSEQTGMVRGRRHFVVGNGEINGDVKDLDQETRERLYAIALEGAASFLEKQARGDMPQDVFEQAREALARAAKLYE